MIDVEERESVSGKGTAGAEVLSIKEQGLFEWT